MGATHDKNELKRQQGSGGIGWLRSPDGYKVIRIEGAGESLHAKWVEVTHADITSSGRPLVWHCRRMLRFNAEQLWHNLISQGWRRVPPQWWPLCAHLYANHLQDMDGYTYSRSLRPECMGGKEWGFLIRRS